MSTGRKSFCILYTVFCILFLLFIPALLNVPLKNYFYPQTELVEGDLIYRIFGSLRGLLADWAFIKGEEYFHNGLPTRTIDASQYFEEEISESREVHGVEEGKHEHEIEEEVKSNFYSKLYSNIKVTSHTHLSYSEEKEVLPWFYLQVRFNPHDIQGYTLGGFWLRRLGKCDEALRFLKEGEKYNPESAQILMAIGEFYFQEKNYDQALKYLERARQLWLNGKPPNLATDNYSKSDRAYTFDMLGNIYEKIGKSALAAQVYRELYSFEPERTFLIDKIRRLERMGVPIKVKNGSHN